jgi:hypothetical protein
MKTMNLKLLVLTLSVCWTSGEAVAARAGNGAVVGNEAANQKKTQAEHAQRQLQNPENYVIETTQKPEDQNNKIQERLNSEVTQLIAESKESGAKGSAEFIAEWQSRGEAAALEEIENLVGQGNLSTGSLEVAKAFMRLKSSTYIKPSVALDAIQNWPNESQRGFTLKIYQAVRAQNKAAKDGAPISADQAFEAVIEDMQEYCAACGC